MHNSSNVNLEMRVLKKTFSSIKLPLAPISNLYTTWVYLWHMLESNLVNMIDFNIFNPYYINISDLFFLMQVNLPANAVDHLPTAPVLLLPTHQLVYCLKMILLLAPTTFLSYVWHCQSGCPLLQYLYLTSILYILGVAWSYFCIFGLTMSKSFVSFMSLRADFVPFVLLLNMHTIIHTCLWHLSCPLMWSLLWEFCASSHHL